MNVSCQLSESLTETVPTPVHVPVPLMLETRPVWSPRGKSLCCMESTKSRSMDGWTCPFLSQLLHKLPRHILSYPESPCMTVTHMPTFHNKCNGRDTRILANNNNLLTEIQGVQFYKTGDKTNCTVHNYTSNPGLLPLGTSLFNSVQSRAAGHLGAI